MEDTLELSDYNKIYNNQLTAIALHFKCTSNHTHNIHMFDAETTNVQNCAEVATSFNRLDQMHVMSHGHARYITSLCPYISSAVFIYCQT